MSTTPTIAVTVTADVRKFSAAMRSMARTVGTVLRNLASRPVSQERKEIQAIGRREMNAAIERFREHINPTPEPPKWGNGCECWVTPESMWTTHYGAVEPGSQIDYNPDCPMHGAAPTPEHDDQEDA